MEKKTGGGGEGGRSSADFGKGNRSYAKVVQGRSRQAMWTTHRITEKEVERLQQYFTDILEFSEEEMAASSKGSGKI
ncbi:hypothetical protein COCNU_06G012070 [Cocos nucifera]|uniref:Uncharacterized protein n=1 Tax=Cocos nucifera TaxID=13894 RepID=A0A8K0N2W8_COCNU|nr:hypothetical protein COCNU_06G012070 [Cocos nucifera]